MVPVSPTSTGTKVTGLSELITHRRIGASKGSAHVQKARDIGNQSRRDGLRGILGDGVAAHFLQKRQHLALSGKGITRDHRNFSLHLLRRLACRERQEELL